MKHTFAEILTIGDEILYGQILDTNSQWISTQLGEAGIKVRWRSTVGDDETDILTAFENSFSRADLIVITGGLGPTSDDLTKPCLAKFFNCELKLNESELVHITDLFQRFGRQMTETNKKQAELPEKCVAIRNEKGTAPGMWFEEKGKIMISIPGVPREMKFMMETKIVPRLKDHFNVPAIQHKVIMTAGIGESFLSDRIKDWEANLPEDLKLAYLPGFGQVRLRLTGIGSNSSEIEKAIETETEKLKGIIGGHIYGYNDVTLEQVVGEKLRKLKLKIACAESCTGGNLSRMITSVPGSSDYFQGCVIPYHNKFKEEILDVSKSTLDQEGAVSENTVRQMSERAKAMFSADIGIATSGIAGPAGGTQEKPVGTVWIGLVGPWGQEAKKFSFGGDREANIHFSTLAALFMLWQRLVQID